MIVPVKISIEIGDIHPNYNFNLDVNPESKEILEIKPDPNWKGESSED